MLSVLSTCRRREVWQPFLRVKQGRETAAGRARSVRGVAQRCSCARSLFSACSAQVWDGDSRRRGPKPKEISEFCSETLNPKPLPKNNRHRSDLRLTALEQEQTSLCLRLPHAALKEWHAHLRPSESLYPHFLAAAPCGRPWPGK